MRSIKHLQPGRGVSICGVITEIDQAPMTVSVGTDSRLAHIFHFTLTDNDSSIQITAWDRVPDFANFKLGEKVHISNVTVKQVLCRVRALRRQLRSRLTSRSRPRRHRLINVAKFLHPHPVASNHAIAHILASRQRQRHERTKRPSAKAQPRDVYITSINDAHL